jgi:acyl-CoA carboxylase subunit alpha
VTGERLINRLLVANRGEIARRIFASARRAGIGCVAVFSDPDSGAPHATEADAAVRLPGASPEQTYLDGPAIVAAAGAAGADAIHPGYGFLAEDASFARAVQAAGLTWVGPPADAIEAMGSKITSKKLAAGAGVPVLPLLDPESVTAFPVLVKASGGGGGRGMRVVGSAADLPAAIQSARREAQSAFGDPTVFCEPLLPGARHVEVQVLADNHGSVWTLTERDCSIQRRYQKVIEETPSPAVGPRLRAELLAAAAAITQTVGYTSAGTAEFLLTPNGQFFFLEFNTRLQVEHPVTECVHRIDLVALQLDIAQGLPLPPAPPAATGHAIEARLYAEDPAAGHRPASGTMYQLSIPDIDSRFSVPPAALLATPAPAKPAPATPGPATPVPAAPVPAAPRSAGAVALRLDAGIEPGSEISPHYDPMLAKLIAWAPTRQAAARRLASALDRARIHGPATNRALLASVLREPRFLAGQADTGLLDGYDLAGLAPGGAAVRLSAVAAALADAAAARAAARVAASLPPGWRNVPSQPQRRSFDGPAGRIETAYIWTRDGVRIEGQGSSSDSPENSQNASPNVVAVAEDHVLLEISGVRHRFDVCRAGGVVWVDSDLGAVALTPVLRLPPPAAAGEGGSLLAPMPGILVRLETAVGAQVKAGQPVLVLEAMKMEHQILAPADGVLAELRVEPGTQVNAGDVLAIVTRPDA